MRILVGDSLLSSMLMMIGAVVFSNMVLNSTYLVMVDDAEQLRTVANGTNFPDDPRNYLSYSEPPEYESHGTYYPAFFNISVRTASLEGFVSSTRLFQFNSSNFFHNKCRHRYHFLTVPQFCYNYYNVIYSTSNYLVYEHRPRQERHRRANGQCHRCFYF